MKSELTLHFKVPLSLRNQLKRQNNRVVSSWENLKDVQLNQQSVVKSDSTEDSWLADMQLQQQMQDIPLLIVNRSKMIQGYGKEYDIYDGFVENTCELMDRNLAFHTSYYGYLRVLEELERGFKEDVFEIVRYPKQIMSPNGELFSLAELMDTIERPTAFDSVNMLKHYLQRCSRDILWKAAIAEEIVNMAEQMHGHFKSEQEDIQIKIDQLYKLRHGFKLRLEKDISSLDQGTIDAIERRIYNIDVELLKELDAMDGLLNVKVQDEKVTKRSSSSAINILDMVVFMILEKIIFKQGAELAVVADYLKKLWVKDFGGLPDKYLHPEMDAEVDMMEKQFDALEMEESKEIKYDIQSKIKSKKTFACTGGLKVLAESM